VSLTCAGSRRGRCPAGGLACAALFACCPPASALDPALVVSQYAHTAWRARHGAPSSAVLDFAQTKDGYLWVGTEFGLLRFDGACFVEWQPPAGTPLPPGGVTRLLASSDGSLWIGTEQGLASWKNGRLTLHAVPGNRGVGYVVATLDESSPEAVDRLPAS